MPTKVWAPGEAVISTDFNLMVQEQVIPTFATAAARNTAIPAPKVGQFCYQASPGVLLQYTDKAVTPGWYRPWDQPWGAIQAGRHIPIDTVFAGLAYIANAGVVFPTARRMVRVQYELSVNKSVDGNDAYIIIRLVNYDNSLVQDKIVSLHQGWWAVMSTGHIFDSGATAGCHLQGFCSWGTAQTSWLRCSVTDEGPAPIVAVGT